MYRLFSRRSIALLIIISLSAGLNFLSARAQASSGPRPVDMMIVIDNSCSMFPRNRILPGCTTWGGDPDFLRIKGASLFLARLGFAEVNEAEYQVGIVNLGDEPTLISPLKPLSDERDELAQQISDPIAQSATRFIPALGLAYRELMESPNRKASNLPAVVLITDGVPWPPEGQGNSDIERLIQENSDITLFIMLLKGAAEITQDYDLYIRFWQQMQTQYSHVYVYPIDDAGQIETTYNQIVAQLHDTIPTEATSVSAEASQRFFISQFVQKMIVTIIHESSESKANVMIVDPLGQVIEDTEEGVSRFRGEDNPVEVISIEAPRLSEFLKEDYWTIKSDKAVTVFVDREGSYQFNFISPSINLTELNNVFLTNERQSSGREFVVKFNLVTSDGSPVRDPQPIWGDITYPDGSINILPAPAYLKPDVNGDYEIRIELANLYPQVLIEPGRFIIDFKAGSSDSQASAILPIATTRLLVDTGPAPFIQSLAPSSITCSQGQVNPFILTIGDFQTVDPASANAFVQWESVQVPLEGDGSGAFKGDLTELCVPLLANLSCSSRNIASFQVQFQGVLADGYVLSPLVSDLSATVVSPECTATAIPATFTPTPKPTPTPTTVPDTDQDGWDDLSDACPSRAGYALFGGCPPPTSLLLLIALVTLGGGGFVALYGFPWLKVRTFAKPPRAYVMACNRGKMLVEPVKVEEIWMKRRTNRVTIGGDRKKAHIYIPGLKPVEFVIAKKKDEVLLLNADSGAVQGAFGMLVPNSVNTSRVGVTLRIGMSLVNMRCTG